MLYSLTERHMRGSTVIKYLLISSNGSRLLVDKDKLTELIKLGNVSNMRLQYVGDEAIFRGKGININEVPVFDLDSNKYRKINDEVVKYVNKPISKTNIYEIIATLVDGDTIKGLRLKNRITGEVGNYTYSSCIEMIRSGKVFDASISSNKVILNGKKIDELPKHSIGEQEVESKQIVMITAMKAECQFVDQRGVVHNLKKGDVLACDEYGKIQHVEASRAQKIFTSGRGEFRLKGKIPSVYSVMSGDRRISLTSEIVIERWVKASIVN